MSADKTQNVGLKKEISILQGISIVVGIIVGSGIFVSPVGVLLYSKSVGLSLIIWIVAGLFSMLGAIVYAELAVTFPRSGGEYLYILETFGPFYAFLALWITFVGIGSASCAANSLIFADYLLRPFYFNCDTPVILIRLVALLGLLVLSFINCYKVTWAAKLAVVFTASKVLALLIIIGIGLYYLGTGSVENFSHPFEDSELSPGSLALSFYQGFWAFAGWNYLNFLVGEVKNPSRSVPIIIITSLTLVTITYLLVNIAYLAVLSPNEILYSGEGSTAVAVIFAVRFSKVLGWIMPLFVGASVFGSINGEVLSMSRLVFAAGEEGHMPELMAMISVNKMTPIPSVLSVVLLGIGFQMYPNVFYLIELTGFAFTLIAAMAVGSLLYVRKTNPGLNKSNFRLPIFLPILFLFVDLAIAALTIYQSPRDSLIGLAVMFSGVPVYIFGIVWKNKPKCIKRVIYNGTIFFQKLLFVVKTESNKSEDIDENTGFI